MAKDAVHAGYLPLLDSAVLVVAARFGFAERHGVDLQIHRERSWAAIRDRMSVGHFDCAQMPAPMPIAMSLSHGPLTARTFAPLVLNTGGNAVTVGNELAAALADESPVDASPAAIGAALRFATARLAERNGRPLRFAVVHRFSGHNYDLRYWLAASGIRPDADIEITVVPPSLLPEALASGQIDGFSAGEPWNTIAVRAEVGEIVATKVEIAPRTPEKVLGVSEPFLIERQDVLKRLIAALIEAGRWCDTAGNHGELARLMADPRHVGVDSSHLLPGLSGNLETASSGGRAVADFLTFAKPGMSRPDPSFAAWLHRQMVRWDHSHRTPETDAIVRGVFRPDIFAAATGDDPGDRAAEAAFDTDRHSRLFDGGLSELSQD
ncbi:CmpA/NrtA family ABC transporter substrate-binding protein [Fulvimarina sp. 2208YS6-2-32]|uniref:CmpA/NrtA family ABC transporter substrate-binding protein n=1 Tax=Fulvimarina uroteuthidis TaxID=3098149 RepID=A0ABU5I0A0_9HYPH|nr:CmpA/NrtA family ABC transporter substrate-binding protein [Fulvimarina sp. 2208YS6-2-32]MDY8108809.1 CmpA/NrtA family ABC transporter substrate-binding protein [Fulvimarina sp. 2208YS6-2-32]